MAEIVAKIDPEALAEIKRIRVLLEQKQTTESLVDMFLDAYRRNVHGLRDIISKDYPSPNVSITAE